MSESRNLNGERRIAVAAVDDFFPYRFSNSSRDSSDRESGAGKSSLVQCGLRSRIPESDALFITLRVHATGLFSRTRFSVDQHMPVRLKMPQQFTDRQRLWHSFSWSHNRFQIKVLSNLTIKPLNFSQSFK